MGATKFKDYFGNATRTFKFASKSSKEDRTDERNLSLYEQLKKYGTPEEKAAIRKLEESQRIKGSEKKTNSFDKGPEVDPYK
jgi:hypothetical protein